MKPCYAQLSNGAFVALHTMSYLCVTDSDTPDDHPEAGYWWDVIGDDVVLYTWNAYQGFNSRAAAEMLERIMLHLANDQGGILVMDDIAGTIAFDLGLEVSGP